MRPRDRSGRLRVVVFGYIVRGPLGGFAWHHLQYVTGLASLGHDVLFVEDSGDYPACYDPQTWSMGIEPGYGLRFIAEAFGRNGVGDRWAYHDGHRRVWHGPRARDVVSFCASSDLLINLNAAERLPPWLATIPVRALVDTDPVFTQIRNLQSVEKHRAAAQHNAFFTFGENIPAGRSTVPTDGFPWQPTRQPIDLSLWRHAPGRRGARWTTIMQWDSYPAVAHAGTRYGMKSASFAAYESLPSRTGEVLEIALGSPSAPRQELEKAGWLIADPLEVSKTPWTYRSYIEESMGEFSVAKQGYVRASSGWFSERTACYLATGRPAIVQDTGFSAFLPCGDGLLPFTSPRQAIEQLERATSAHPSHCAAAREIACEYFDAKRVLSDLVERAMSSAGPTESVRASATFPLG